ncbi:MAG: RNA-binding transcriptional accessory protein [Acidobacteria bacterium]|nr:MAG: RNA-binding transcriptional accessory protein [Acidobacteriota bacterium]
MVEQVAVLANELNLAAKGVAAVVALLADKNTVPFIARYRKEATGGLDEVQIRAIEERRAYLSELEDRRAAIAVSIEEQGKLTPELRARIDACSTKAELEDLYLPYKRQRRTRGMIARERGLEPLADRILAQPASGNPATEAAAFVDPKKDVADVDAALAGARDIVAEIVAENATVRAAARQIFGDQGELVSKAVPKNTKQPTKFEQYYDFREPVKTIPSHRFLAIMRGERDKVLRAHVEVDSSRLTRGVERTMGLVASSPFSAQLAEAIRDGYKRLLAPSVENDVRAELKLRSDRAAVDVFADNLRNLLLAAPLGSKAVIGIDPGLRTGCKCVAVDQTGKFLDNLTIYLAGGNHSAAARDFAGFVKKHRPVTIAVGNGTGGRETELFVRKLLRDIGVLDLFVVQVNEAGASVYSASDVAREEFPELDLTVRGAISIARRLQDPLAELVKIDPKAIGVGQYQHDVHQPLLQKKLTEVVESCVNHVGVDLNTASAPLLSYVAGIGSSIAKKIIVHREKNGAFASRKQLLEVSGLGPRAFEQAAGFLRIHGGGHPLDASAVHPERYRLVARMAEDLKVEMGDLVGDSTLARRIDITCYAGEGVGEPTLRDIVAELDKPGRDPREEFEPPKFRDDVNSLEDLQEGMQLEGVVTNVTAFGAFVDVGVHQDGLVHVSQLADRFVKDPKDVVKVGDRLSVRVLDIDLARGRISLSARKEGGGRSGNDKSRGENDRPKRRERSSNSEGYRNNPFAALRDREK